MAEIKTRFAPSPTGRLHVGGARTALFNFLLARRAGGKFLLRIEDTDRARHDESAVTAIIEDLRWLSLDWDEGIEAGGDAGPYRQSQRLEIYSRYIEQLLLESKAYYVFDTPEELAAMRNRAGKEGFRYPRPDPLSTPQQAQQAEAEGKPVAVRFICPAEDLKIHDEAFGDVTMPAGEMEDFIIRKADGYPTFYLANVIDDTLMGVTLICRGQEFLGQTWRQSALRRALGFDEPKFLHLPLIMDAKGRKLSKRDGDVDVHAFRSAGYLPETIVNFIALLGWNPGGDVEKFSLEQLIELFDPARIGKSNAKFDRDKLLAFSAADIAAASTERLTDALRDYLSLNETAIPTDDKNLLAALLQANKGIRTLADVHTKCDVLFRSDDAFDYDQKAVKKVLLKNSSAGYAVLADLREKLADCDWSAQAMEILLNEYCQSNNLSLGKIAQPLRLAVTGTTVSPAIYDTLIFLGKEKTLTRIDRCINEA